MNIFSRLCLYEQSVIFKCCWSGETIVKNDVTYECFKNGSLPNLLNGKQLQKLWLNIKIALRAVIRLGFGQCKNWNLVALLCNLRRNNMSGFKEFVMNVKAPFL